MRLRNEAQAWGAVSIALHWLTFVLVLGMALLGLNMTELPTGTFKVQVYALHKSLGLTILGLTALRLLWRAFASRPTPVPAPRWQQLAASGSHGALYALLVLVPLSGWWFNSASGFPLRWFGLVRLPALTTYDAQLKHLAKETHETLFFFLAAVVAVHAAAALWHHYFVRDRTLARMLPLMKSKDIPS
jgi:cytochrome b561